MYISHLFAINHPSAELLYEPVILVLHLQDQNSEDPHHSKLDKNTFSSYPFRSLFSGSRADWMNSCLWVPSQYGGLAVYLQPHSQALESFSGMKRRGIRPWALVLWVPSQKGCFLLCPQVHHEWRFPPTSSTLKGFLEAMTGSLDRLESWTFGAVIIGHVQGCIKVAETNLRTLSDMIVFMFGCGCVLLIK